MKPGYIYIMGSKDSVLYIGVTSDIYTRVCQHKNGAFSGFSKHYGCTRLLYYETHEDISESIAREKQLKRWRRDKKLALIRATNPHFKDLAANWGRKFLTAHESIHAPTQKPSS